MTIKNILTRASVRVYRPDVEIPSDRIELILRAAMAAPTAVNRQPWQFVVVNDKEKLASLADSLPYAKMTAKASLAIITCGDKRKFLEGIDSTLWVQDLSAANENILLAAHALGLGGVWTCVYPHSERENPVRRILQLPDDIVPFAVIPIGVPTHAPHIMEKWDPSKIHHNKW